MDFKPSKLLGCFEIVPRVHRDHRGTFTKIFHADSYRSRSIRLDVEEEYFSTSVRGVIRGFHFQVPPSDHDKLVYAVAGTVLDVVVDLRRDSPTFAATAQFELRGDQGNAVFIPRGLGHAFLTLSESATMVYKTSSVHDPKCDKGVRWDSVGFDWPVHSPIISDRDSKLPSLDDFDTPFEFR